MSTKKSHILALLLLIPKIMEESHYSAVLTAGFSSCCYAATLLATLGVLFTSVTIFFFKASRPAIELESK